MSPLSALIMFIPSRTCLDRSKLLFYNYIALYIQFFRKLTLWIGDILKDPFLHLRRFYYSFHVGNPISLVGGKEVVKR